MRMKPDSLAVSLVVMTSGSVRLANEYRSDTLFILQQGQS